MTPFERWSGYTANLLAGGTGVVYGAMVYLLRPSDPYAVVNHPLQPLVQHLHVLTAPLLVFAVALVWQRHVAPRLGRRGYPRRTTGLGLALLFVPMAASGYLLQVASDEAMRKAWGWLHLGASLLWLGAFVVHLLSPSGKRARRGAEAGTVS